MPLNQIPGKPIEAFFFYVSEDEKIHEDIEKQLGPLKWNGRITGWHEQQVSPGKDRELEIMAHVNSAHVFVVLVSMDFVHSPYCYGYEMKRAMSRHNAGEACVIPVIARAVDWGDTAFGGLQELPKGKRAIMSCHHYDEALKDVAAGIREVLNERASVFFAQPTLSDKSFIHTSNSSERLPNYDNLASEMRASPQSTSRFREEAGQSMQTFTKTIKIFKLIETFQEDDN